MKAITPVAFAALAAACHHEAPPASTTTSSSVVVTTTTPIGEYKVGENGAQTITIDGVHIETAPDLPDRSSNVSVEVNSGNAGDGQTVVVLRGWPIRMAGGRVNVLGRDYGAVQSGETVRLAKDGVHVGAELRGPLP